MKHFTYPQVMFLNLTALGLSELELKEVLQLVIIILSIILSIIKAVKELKSKSE